jgi:repressor of nif and glnA expression
MSEKTEKKKLAILRILQESEKPVSSSKINEQLLARGHETSERTVRFYLLEMDKEGLTENRGKRGRQITELGLKELSGARVYDKLGLMAAKIDEKTYGMHFDLRTKSGTVVVNMSCIDRNELTRSIPLIQRVFSAGYAMGELLTIYPPGQRVGEITIPEDSVGIGTVCSVTLNGVLLSHGIPTHSRFGGLLEIHKGKPTRFVELVHYEGTTIDPLEIFIKSGMTDYTGATDSGNGLIGAGFRELPSGSRNHVIELAEKLKAAGLGGFLCIGWPGQPLFDIPVSEGRLGAIVIGGLNPVAILEEQGIKTRSRALAFLADYQSLFSYKELDTKVNEMIRRSPKV